MFTFYIDAVGEERDTAALVAHEHVALEGRDDVEACDEDAEVADYSFLFTGIR